MDAVIVAIISLGGATLLTLIGLVVQMIRWQATQTIYSKAHQAGIDDINEHLSKLNSQVIKNMTDIARLQGPSP